MQKPWRSSRPTDAHEIASRVEEAEKRGVPVNGLGLEVHRAQVLAMADAPNSGARQATGGQIRQHQGERHDHRPRGCGVFLHTLQMDRIVTSQAPTGDTHEGRKVGTDAERPPEIVGERAHVEARGTLDLHGHSIAAGLEQIQPADSDLHRSGQAGQGGQAG